MKIAEAVVLLLVAGCGSSVVPAEASIADTGVSRVGLDCRGIQCGPQEICVRFDGTVCRATPAGCNPQLRPCVGAECLDPSPCEPCVAEAMNCGAGTTCAIDRNRASSGFVDAYCRPAR